jgi:hypothetical protein
MISAFNRKCCDNDNVKSVTSSSSVMGNEIYLQKCQALTQTVKRYTLSSYIDYDFIPSFNIELKEGRNFRT